MFSESKILALLSVQLREAVLAIVGTQSSYKTRQETPDLRFARTGKVPQVFSRARASLGL